MKSLTVCFIINSMVSGEDWPAKLNCVTYHNLVKAADEGHTTHAVVMDFKKTFDKVPHLMLLQKLKKVPGVNGYLLNWILDFLSD